MGHRSQYVVEGLGAEILSMQERKTFLQPSQDDDSSFVFVALYLDLSLVVFGSSSALIACCLEIITVLCLSSLSKTIG